MRHLDLGGCVQHRPDGAHAVVVVVEGGELLGAQLVRLHDLAGQGRRLHTETSSNSIFSMLVIASGESILVVLSFLIILWLGLCRQY